ncbi:helix-turn-helix domain-containing protein [Kribbella speibonae]|uniref:Helix-turn-helix domain-containing protein n=1 Tax=Kribbella speibonae TaxID=1572660 RepID=A0A4V2M3H1_9ACTN|nr:helix-turn-helix domain-containing protein [Kribbella speibonae]TCC32032.1 helix-turn-helix domain-containing protein [Kribbella speibonae]
MSRPHLPIGTWGNVRSRAERKDAEGKVVSWRASAYFRDHDGRTREVTASAKTKGAAEHRLLTKLRDRAKLTQYGELSPTDKINDLIDLWIEKLEERIEDGRRSPTTLTTYRTAIKNHVRPALGELLVGEATTPRIDRVIGTIKRNAGRPTAKTCRAVISGMMQLAVRYGALTVNPVREVEAVESRPKNPPRALTNEEIAGLRQLLTTDEAAVHADLPDLVLFMLGTGVRIGESLAVLWSQVNLESGAVEITHTMARVPGQGLIRKAPKSKAGERALPLPDWAVTMLRRRHAAGIHPDAPIFADSRGGFRDPSNVRRALRRALSPVASTARRDLGQVLRSARLQAGLTRKEVVKKLGWPKTRLELIESGRIKVDRELVATLVKTYRINLDASPTLSAQVDQAAQPSPSDALTWIRSHTFRKTTATALDRRGQSARQIADHLGQAQVSITQDVYMGRRIHNPSAATALDQEFADLDLW